MTTEKNTSLSLSAKGPWLIHYTQYTLEAEQEDSSLNLWYYLGLQKFNWNPTWIWPEIKSWKNYSWIIIYSLSFIFRFSFSLYKFWQNWLWFNPHARTWKGELQSICNRKGTNIQFDYFKNEIKIGLISQPLYYREFCENSILICFTWFHLHTANSYS